MRNFCVVKKRAVKGGSKQTDTKIRPFKEVKLKHTKKGKKKFFFLVAYTSAADGLVDFKFSLIFCTFASYAKRERNWMNFFFYLCLILFVSEMEEVKLFTICIYGRLFPAGTKLCQCWIEVLLTFSL